MSKGACETKQNKLGFGAAKLSSLSKIAMKSAGMQPIQLT